jgi:hypothetical protein
MHVFESFTSQSHNGTSPAAYRPYDRARPHSDERLDGEEVHGLDGDKLSINQETGGLTVSRIEGFEEVTTHYSPSAWASVTHRIKEPVVRPSLVGNNKK